MESKKRYKRLFEPGQIGKMQLKNRMKFASTTPHIGAEDGIVTDQEIAFHVERAKGGAALITTAGASPHPSGCSSFDKMTIDDDSKIPRLSELAQAIHAEGAKACFQILHTGRYARPKEGQPVGPSVIPPKVSIYRLCRELAIDEIRELVTAHAEAARRAKEAGFDCVEIGALAGYLIASFLSPWTNRRTDEYGGRPGA